MVAGEDADVLRLTGMGLAQNEVTRTEAMSVQEGGVMSIIPNVDRAAEKLRMMGVGTIGSARQGHVVLEPQRQKTCVTPHHRAPWSIQTVIMMTMVAAARRAIQSAKG